MLTVLSALASAPRPAGPSSEPGPRNQPSGHSPIRSAYRHSLSPSSLPGRRPGSQIVADRSDVPPDRYEFPAGRSQVDRPVRVDAGLLERTAYLVGALRWQAQAPPG